MRVYIYIYLCFLNKKFQPQVSNLTSELIHEHQSHSFIMKLRLACAENSASMDLFSPCKHLLQASVLLTQGRKFTCAYQSPAHHTSFLPLSCLLCCIRLWSSDRDLLPHRCVWPLSKLTDPPLRDLGGEKLVKIKWEVAEWCQQGQRDLQPGPPPEGRSRQVMLWSWSWETRSRSDKWRNQTKKHLRLQVQPTTSGQQKVLLSTSKTGKQPLF